MPYFSRMSVTFFKIGLKWLGYMYIKGFGVELASYQNFKSNMVSGKCAKSIIFESFSAMIFKIGPFPH